MKKGFLLVFVLSLLFIVGCSSKGHEEQLLDYYVEAYTKADYNLLKKVFPEVLIENYKKEDLDLSVQLLKDTYGEGYKITYKILSKEKLDDTDYLTLSKMYNNTELSDCSKLDTVISYSGPKTSKDDAFDLFYCKIDGDWYLLI